METAHLDAVDGGEYRACLGGDPGAALNGIQRAGDALGEWRHRAAGFAKNTLFEPGRFALAAWPRELPLFPNDKSGSRRSFEPLSRRFPSASRHHWSLEVLGKPVGALRGRSCFRGHSILSGKLFSAL